MFKSLALARPVAKTDMPRRTLVAPISAGPQPLDTPLVRRTASPFKLEQKDVAFLISDLGFRLFPCDGVVQDLALGFRGTPLHHAAYHGRLDEVNALLQQGANPASQTHSHGMSPLHLAALRGHSAVARRLLEAGAQPQARDRCRRRTAARWAHARGHKYVAQLLDAPTESWLSARC